MMSCTTSGVRPTQHEIWFVTRRVRHENGRGSGSPVCSSSRLVSIESPARRGGVPVLNRRNSRPSRPRSAPRPRLGRSPNRPPGRVSSPVWSSPPRKVPVVSNTARALSRRPSASRTPAAQPPSTMRPATSPSITSRPRRPSSNRRTMVVYRLLSHWARGPQTAGPLDRLSILN